MRQQVEFNKFLRRLLYTLYYNREIIKNVCHFHHIKLPDKFPEDTIPFSLKKEEKREWYDLFQADYYEGYIPFTSFSKITSMPIHLFEYLNSFDLNLANLLHVKCSMWINPERPELNIDTPYQAKHYVCDVVRIDFNRICFIAKTEIYYENTPIINIKNAFLIVGLRPQDAHLFDSLHHYSKHNPEIFCGLSKKLSVLYHDPDAAQIEFFIPHGMGKQYGILSGDMNPIHTNQFLAKLTGSKNAFIQGLCSFNLIVSQFTLAGFYPFEKINMTFCQKIYEDQSVVLLHKDRYFELTDTSGQLLIFGRLHQIRS